MLEQILQECKNWFVREIRSGEFTVADGRLALPFLQDGQYFRIVGSVFNDGLHKCPAEDLTDETFEGAVWALAIPRAVIELGEKVGAWEKENSALAQGIYQSENIPTYSYTKITGKNGGPITWKEVFYRELANWRKIM